MNRLHTTAAALLVFAIAGSGCARNKSLPNQLAPARLTTIGVNAYLWRAALDQDLRADALRVSGSRQVSQNGAWVDAPLSAATVQKLEDIILTRARDLRRSAVPGVDNGRRTRGSA